MAKHVFFKEEFERLAVGGLIGRPDGKPAYAYIRVSSDEQGDEGRSGLPRQIEHVHQKAIEAGYCITWDRVFADDFTGFALERPELSRLRREYTGQRQRALALVMEHLDRLSRNADWHQGYLLDEMKQAGIEPVFWKSFSSRVERAVLGAVAQEGMEQAKQRMMDGNLHKARDGRVTARTAAYGLKLVDEQGRGGDRAKKFTYYALHEVEAPIMRQIYQRVANGDTLHQIAADLAAVLVPPPKRTAHWEGTILRVLIKNPVYKGVFIAHRWIEVKVQKRSKDGLSTRTVTRREARPESEWIRVQVPAIVDAATWQAANDMLARNRAMARRNAQEPYLLTSLITCATCGYTYVGVTHRKKNGKLRPHEYRGYRCPNFSARPKHIRKIIACDQGYISAPVIENAVWSVVCNALFNPQALLDALKSDVFNEHNAQLERQIAYLEGEIVARQAEDEKLYRAYVAGVFDETEYGERRTLLKADTAQLHDELGKLYPQRVTKEQFEAQEAIVRQFAEQLHSLSPNIDPPFELKQRILKMTVNRITLNVREKSFRLDGTIRGIFAIDSILVDMDSAPAQAGNSPEKSAIRWRG